jgi:4a-hydroxytetrahydrobiopterin dehydratase
MSTSKEDLASRRCVPCKGGTPPLTQPEIEPLLAQLEDWQAVDAHHLTKTFKFENFVDALSFVNHFGQIAEKEGHHPDIYLAWGKVRVDIWTHKINGLTESDFVLAAKGDRAYADAAAR